MEFFISVIIAFIIGIVIGGWLVYRSIIKNVSDHPRKMIDILEKIEKLNQEEQSNQDKENRSDLSSIKTEEYNGVTYLFDKHTDEFLAQGATFAEALSLADKRFPNRFVVIIKDFDNQSA